MGNKIQKGFSKQGFGNFFEPKVRKGVSVVIATILMVMIIVGLVAFSYIQFVEWKEKQKDSVDGPIIVDHKYQQNFDVPIAYECENDSICFELRASSENSCDIPANETGIFIYVDNIPAILESWDRGRIGNPCKNLTKNLRPGESCYGKVNHTCQLKDTHTLRISHIWGKIKLVKVTCTK